ncbi:LytR C-terminal domain-containing protein [Aeromicrobium fastidiosum]|uniref:LytR C-terminal domain-containing protein n=1 Tax=Aeromicrobium TaxID=2040 RepID=UPI0017859DA2|nr:MULTISPECIES: LytR C-terminal domain-containing protein [Aeromicrobium]MBD8608594.1 LytR C-terminal domain-containing protein [Aeromicrobium sp. CFBP 8757]MCL8252921.1 LytR C-terminal domain-containing protein [Aeromicrobium fastidiosum]
MRVLTLTVATAVFLLGGVVGFRLLTASTGDAVEAAPTCRNEVITAGDPIDSNVITVNVFNASSRSGLANRALIELQANGFRGGQIGNSDSAAAPRRVAILTDTPDDPRVALVAAQFKDKVEYAAPDITVEDGIIVVVGDRYRGLKTGAATSTTSATDMTVCVPVVPLA